jgi:hypothetical protein
VGSALDGVGHVVGVEMLQQQEAPKLTRNQQEPEHLQQQEQEQEQKQEQEQEQRGKQQGQYQKLLPHESEKEVDTNHHIPAVPRAVVAVSKWRVRASAIAAEKQEAREEARRSESR